MHPRTWRTRDTAIGNRKATHIRPITRRSSITRRRGISMVEISGTFAPQEPTCKIPQRNRRKILPSIQTKWVYRIPPAWCTGFHLVHISGFLSSFGDLSLSQSRGHPTSTRCAASRAHHLPMTRCLFTSAQLTEVVQTRLTISSDSPLPLTKPRRR